MAQGIKTYDPSNVQIILGGNPITGFADGTFVNISPNSDAFTSTTGADGETSRSKSNDRTATVTLTLKQTSSSNDVLSGLYVADQLNNEGAVPLMIKEIGSGRTLCFAQAAWVGKLPDTNYSKDIEDRAWELKTGALDIFIGGNATNAQSEV